jgi:uncharacterized membrane protein
VRIARLAFSFLSVLWIVLVLTAPVAALGGAASLLTYLFGSFICHQRPERSFHLGVAQLPVCARCFGLYAGALMGVMIAGLKPCASNAEGSTRWWWNSLSGLRTLLVVTAVPTAVTWTSEMLGLWAPGNATRFVAALPLGVAVAVTVNYIECARPLQTGHRPLPPVI